MKKSLISSAIAAATLVAATAISTTAQAADELVIQTVKGGESAEGYTVVLNGEEQQRVGANGLVSFDLDGGSHSVEIQQDGATVHRFDFDAESGQLTDINVALDGSPTVAVESYYEDEAAGERANAAMGTVNGRVRASGFPAIGATVRVLGTDIEAETDETGIYELKIPRGIYTIEVNHPDFGSSKKSGYRVISNVTLGANFSISPSFGMVEEVQVIAKVNTSAFLENEQFASNVINTMDVEQLARFGGADVAASVIRLPSVTVQSSKFIFIRGLGGRYISTSLNGGTMPSTNPNRRTVPLDLFPSNMVEQLDIKKSFIASMPGESTGGNLVINTRSFPDDTEGKLSFSLGYVDGLTGSSAYADPLSGDFDVIGWDDGTRREPGIVTAIVDALEQNPNLPVAVQQELGQYAARRLVDGFDLDRTTATPDISLGLNYGDIFYLDSLDADLGYFVAANYKNQWSQRTDGVSRTYGGRNASVLTDDFRFEQNANQIESSGLIALGLEMGSSSYASNTLLSRVSESQVIRSEGFDGDALEDSIRWSIQWEERMFLSQQFTGEHFFGADEEWTADWQFTISRATRLAPDRREVRFNLSDGDGVYNLEIPNLTRQYDDLVDNNLDASANFEYLLGGDTLDSTLSFGFQLISRERDADSVTYGFNAQQQALNDNAPNTLVSDIINTANVTGNAATGLNFQNKTLPSDSYDAEMDMTSLYLSWDALWQTVYQFVVGLRYEDYEQTTDTFSLQGAQTPQQSLIDESIVLPSLNFNWYYGEDEQLRVALSQTVSRPDFKETSNATFYDDECDCRVRGNANLKQSEIFNADLRWEKYWTDQESISVALFYKDIDNAIERVALTASGTAGNSRTFRNAQSANIYGIEVDTRKDFPLDESFSKNTFVTFNASWIESEAENDGRKRNLQGQPQYTLNLILGYDDADNGHEVTLLFNQNGKSIADVGVSGQPDIVEEPRLDLNLNYKYTLSENFTISAKLKNLLDSEVERTQGGNVFRQYKKGLEFSAGLDWKF